MPRRPLKEAPTQCWVYYCATCGIPFIAEELGARSNTSCPTCPYPTGRVRRERYVRAITREQLRSLVAVARATIAKIDARFAPGTVLAGVGKEVATIMNALDIATQVAARFGLGERRKRKSVRRG